MIALPSVMLRSVSAFQIAVGSGDGSVTSLDALMILQAAAGGIEIG